MIKIKKICWLSKDAEEAEVYLSDGNFTIICFSHPFRKEIESAVRMPLYTLNATDVERLNDSKEFAIRQEDTPFAYKLAGVVFNRNSNQVKMGAFIINLDNPLPNDILEGDFVSFYCDRLDFH